MITLMLFILLCLPLSATAATDNLDEFLSAVEKAKAEVAAEILIFSLSADKVKSQKGVLKIQISTFSSIQQVTVKGKPRKFPKGASLVWLKIPYTLNPGVNIFAVYVKSKLGGADNFGGGDDFGGTDDYDDILVDLDDTLNDIETVRRVIIEIKYD